MATGAVEQGRSRQSDDLWAVTVSDDGTTIAATHPGSRPIALFHGPSLEPLGEPIPAGRVRFVPVFTPDGDLIGNGRFGVVARWEMDAGVWAQLARRTAGRNLSAAEWAEHIGGGRPRATCAEWPSG